MKTFHEKLVGGLRKKGKTARTPQMASISTLIHSANRRKYSVSDTFDPAQEPLEEFGKTQMYVMLTYCVEDVRL